MKRLITSMILLLTVLALLPGQAAAHADLEKSEPAAGSTTALANAPTTLTLVLTEELAKEGNVVKVLHDGTDYADGAPTLDFDNPKMLTVKLKALPAGAYTVEWNTLTAEDNGPSDGQFTFTIADAAGGTGGGTTTTGGTASGQTTPAAPLPTTGAADELSALLLLAAGAVLLGGGLVLRRRTRRV